MSEKTKGKRIYEIKPEGTGTSRIAPEMEANWIEIQGRLKDSLGAKLFNTWLSSLRIVSFAGGRLIMSSPSPFRREYVVSNYLERLKLLWKHMEPTVRALEVIVEPDRQAGRPSLIQSHPPIPGRTTKTSLTSPRSSVPARTGMGTGFLPPGGTTGGILTGASPNRDFRFDNFVVGDSNQLAFASARHIATETSKRFSGLYLHSASGFGKTHLLNAIGNEALNIDPDLKVGYFASGIFMNHFGQATRDNDQVGFRETIRSLDLLLVDDLQFICGRQATFVEFIQTFNAFQDAGKRIIIAADHPASELEGIGEHARTRLGGLTTVEIRPPDYELRKSILKRKLADMRASGRAVEISETVIEYIARKIESNPRELEGALRCVANNSEVGGAQTTLEQAQELVRHLVRSSERRITIEDIQKKVATFYQVSMKDLLSHRRDRVIVRPRQVAMFLAKEMTTRSLPEIGRRFGNRDHTTVLYGVRRIAEMRKENTALSDEIDLLKRMIEN